jgi:hypothetical protein
MIDGRQYREDWRLDVICAGIRAVVGVSRVTATASARALRYDSD